MSTLLSTRSRLPLAAQSFGLAAMFATLALLPPERGRMLVISLPGAEPGLPARILGAHAALIARGPLPNSYIVEGDATRLRPAVGHAALVAAPRAGCGTAA